MRPHLAMTPTVRAFLVMLEVLMIVVMAVMTLGRDDDSDHSDTGDDIVMDDKDANMTIPVMMLLMLEGDVDDSER